MSEQNAGARTELKARSVTHILPDDEVNWLLSLGPRWRSEYWRIGDDIAQTKDFVKANNLPMTMASIDNEFSQLTGGERSARTMRYLESVARHFPNEPDGHRYIYSDVPHYFFGIIMRYPGWEYLLLELSQQKIESMGKSPGETWLYKEIERVVVAPTIDGTPPDIPAVEDVIIREGGWQDLPIAMPQPDPGAFIGSLHDLSVKIDLWDIKPSQRTKIKRAIRLLEGRLKKINNA